MLRRINPAETGLSVCRYHVVSQNSHIRRPQMTQPPADRIRRPWLRRTRAAALGFGLGATLALSPLVWAQNPAATAVPEQTAPVPQQSFAPLVKKVLPAVVNISVTEKSGVEGLADRLPEQFRGSPFDDFLRRFFDQHNGEEGQSFRGGPD